jgi:hypothetical protein
MFVLQRSDPYALWLQWSMHVLKDLFGDTKLLDGKTVSDKKGGGAIVFRVFLAARTYPAVNPLLDTIESVYMSGDGTRATILAAATCADEINTAIREETPLRTLVGPRSTGECRCGQCGKVTHEDDISYKSALTQVCSACIEQTAGTSLSVKNLSHSIKKERAMVPDQVFDDTHLELAREILALIKNNEHGATEDIYVPGAYRNDFGPAHNRRSFDAIFQTVRRPNGTKGLHTAVPLNVGATAIWINLAKHTSTPGMLVIFLKRRKVEQRLKTASIQDRTVLLAKLQALRDQEREMFLVQLQTSHTKSARLSGTISKSAWERLLYQRKSGKLLSDVSDDVKARAESYTLAPLPPRTRWRPGPGSDFQDRLLPLIEQIITEGAKETGLQVPRGKDGCPFPGDREDMPDDWSWWNCWMFVGFRLVRLWLFCNGKWICIICTETLFLTWLYSYVNGIRGVTGVTWNLLGRHPRGIVFAHDRHGEQMVDFFPFNSTSLDDLREPEDRNLRPETKFDNYGVSNWEQKDKAAIANIRDQLDNIRIPKELFDPDCELPRKSTPTAEDTVAINENELGLLPGNDATLDFAGGEEDGGGTKAKRQKVTQEEVASDEGSAGEDDGSEESSSEDDGGEGPSGKAPAKNPTSTKKSSKSPSPKPATTTRKGKGKAWVLPDEDDDEEDAKPVTTEGKGKGKARVLPDDEDDEDDEDDVKPATARGKGKRKTWVLPDDEDDEDDAAALQTLRDELRTMEAQYRERLDNNQPYAIAAVAALEGDVEGLRSAMSAARSIVEEQDRENDD